MIEAEEMRDRFHAAARDLGLALSGLQALVAADVAPADVAEDVAAVQRQLGAARFSSAAAAEQLAAQLLQVGAPARCCLCMRGLTLFGMAQLPAPPG